MSTKGTKVLVRNAAGQTRELSPRTWDLMRNSRDRDGNTRKGWTLVEEGVRVLTTRPVLPSKTGAVPFVPPEIQEAKRLQEEAEAKRVAAMISGEKEQAAKEAAAAAEGEKPSDKLEEISGIGAKVAEALKAKGITTYKALADANPAAINAILDEVGMSPKKAQVPSWKMRAKELAATPAA